MATLVVFKGFGEAMETYHEFESAESLLKHLEHHVDDWSLVIVVKREKFTVPQYLKIAWDVLKDGDTTTAMEWMLIAMAEACGVDSEKLYGVSGVVKEE